MPDPFKITLVLKGLIAIFVNPAKTECTVGMLSNAPSGHTLKISFKKQPQGGVLSEFRQPLTPPQVKSRLRLAVRNISQDRITFRGMDIDINRHVDATPATRPSFKWVVDLENDELYGAAIGANKSAFAPVLTFSNGELFTRRISTNHLFIQRGIFTTEDFGFVANEIGVDFPLDQAPDSKGVFYNGGDAIPLDDQNTNYEIEINHDAAAHSGIITDANHYYKGVGLGLTDAQRILFMSNSSGGGPAGPEAACFSAFLGQSQPG
jgi:hypothetical protein